MQGMQTPTRSAASLPAIYYGANSLRSLFGLWPEIIVCFVFLTQVIAVWKPFFFYSLLNEHHGNTLSKAINTKPIHTGCKLSNIFLDSKPRKIDKIGLRHLFMFHFAEILKYRTSKYFPRGGVVSLNIF